MSLRESYPESISWRLHGGEAVGDAVAAARGFGEANGLAKDDMARLCIVVEELVTNLYEHGGQAETDPIELSLARDAGALRIALVDSAKPFDLNAAPASSRPSERGAGVGIDLVRAWAEFVDYRSTSAGNRLELLLPLIDHGR